MTKPEKCMCEYCKIQRGEGKFQIAERRRLRKAILFSAARISVGFALGWTIAELLK